MTRRGHGVCVLVIANLDMGQTAHTGQTTATRGPYSTYSLPSSTSSSSSSDRGVQDVGTVSTPSHKALHRRRTMGYLVFGAVFGLLGVVLIALSTVLYKPIMEIDTLKDARAALAEDKHRDSMFGTGVAFLTAGALSFFGFGVADVAAESLHRKALKKNGVSRVSQHQRRTYGYLTVGACLLVISIVLMVVASQVYMPILGIDNLTMVRQAFTQDKKRDAMFGSGIAVFTSGVLMFFGFGLTDFIADRRNHRTESTGGQSRGKGKR